MRGPPEDSCVVLAYHAIRSNQPKSPRAALIKPSSPISGCGGANERPGSPGALHSNREAQEQRGFPLGATPDPDPRGPDRPKQCRRAPEPCSTTSRRSTTAAAITIM